MISNDRMIVKGQQTQNAAASGSLWAELLRDLMERHSRQPPPEAVIHTQLPSQGVTRILPLLQLLYGCVMVVRMVVTKIHAASLYREIKFYRCDYLKYFKYLLCIVFEIFIQNTLFRQSIISRPQWHKKPWGLSSGFPCLQCNRCGSSPPGSRILPVDQTGP